MDTMKTNTNDGGLLEEHTTNRELSGEGFLEESIGSAGLLEESTGSEGLLEEAEYHINRNYCSECGNKYSSPSMAFCPQCGHPRKVKKTW